MSIILLPKSSIDETQYVIDYLTQEIPKYKFGELTNNRYGDIPNIYDSHPIALEYGNLMDSLTGEGESFTSILPAIGVEMIPDNLFSKQPLGRMKPSGVEVDQEFIDELKALPMKERINTGWKIPDSTIDELQNALDDKTKLNPPLKLLGTRALDIHTQSVTVSIWSPTSQTKKLIYNIVRSVLKRMRFELAKQSVKDVKMETNFSMYNYDFDRTLFGSEIKVSWLHAIQDIEVNTDLLTIKDVEDYLVGPNLNTNLKGFNPVTRGEASEEN